MRLCFQKAKKKEPVEIRLFEFVCTVMHLYMHRI